MPRLAVKPCQCMHVGQTEILAKMLLAAFLFDSTSKLREDSSGAIGPFAAR